jgi:hypothetical protein
MKAILLFILMFVLYATPIVASSVSPATINRIEARVGEYSLTVTGYASQNASINIKTNNLLMASTTAGADGSFSFMNLPIKKGLDSICFDVIDIARIGRSTSCIRVQPANGDILLKDIYLAPTIGLEKSSITEGSSGLVYGFTMPNASIDIKMNNGSRLTTRSDQLGKYSYTVGNLPVGTYEMTSLGTYHGSKSLNPTSGVTLEVLTSSIAFTNQAVGLRRSLVNWLPWILLAIPVTGLGSFLLIKKYRPQWLSFVEQSRVYRWLLRKFRRDLHHAWFVGY